MEKELTIPEAMGAYEHNPEAAALAVGMVLMQGSRNEVDRLTKVIDESNQNRIAELEKQLAYWRPLGKKWLTLKYLLADEKEALA